MVEVEADGKDVPRHPWLLVAVRGGLLAVCGGLALAGGSPDSTASTVVALVLVALLGSIPVGQAIARRLQPAGEAVLAALVLLTVDPLPDTFLPYLLAPALAAGLTAGAISATTAAGLAALVLLLGRVAGAQQAAVVDYLGPVSQWVLVSLGVGLLAAWVRRVQSTAPPERNAAYAAAYRLVSQLRRVSRQLSGGLEPVSLAQALLDAMQSAVGFARGAVLVHSEAGVLVPLAVAGSGGVDWDTSLREGSLLAQAWRGGEPVRRDEALTAGRAGHSAVLPLRIDGRSVGLVALEREQPPYELATLEAAVPLVDESALRLETALLFSEVRSIATAEERRRLAREIHDGIAQELASLGYAIDDLSARADGDPELATELRGLRAEVSRVITELRLSIFDLRSEVQPSAGLGSALSDHVRAVGAGSDLTVHLVLDESPRRLPVETEAELLRIAQEAITNARRHANAANLWVSARVDSPRATLRVEDDGVGLGAGRADSFGLEIMRERAARIGASLVVGERAGRGTLVEVVLGDGSVASPARGG